MLRLTLLFAICAAACGGENRSNATSSSGSASAAPAAKADAGTLTQLAAELAAIPADAPAPAPQLPAGTALNVANTIVIAQADLALLRGEPPLTTVRVPERAILVELLVKERGGTLQNPHLITDASRATALEGIKDKAYVAVITERAWLKNLSRQTVAIWDRKAKAWIGSLWITLPLTEAPDKEMAMFNSMGKQLSPSFTVSEKPEERELRHRREIRGVVDKAITDRTPQWVALSKFEMPGPAFAPDKDKQYVVAVPADSPSRGAADAKVTVQLFAQHGEPEVALLVARIAQTYGDRVRIVWRDFPLSFKKDNEPAANAAREVQAAKGAEAFWSYLEALAARKTGPGAELTTDILVEEAERQGVDGARVRKAIESRAHRAAIEADLAAFRGAKLPTKPSIASFTNGWTLSTTSFAAHAPRIEAAAK